MRLRRSIIAAVLAPTMALATVTPAVAETTTQSSGAEGSSTTTEGSSTKESDEWWENLNPFAKVAIGIAAATGISVAFGVLRTIFYNIFHV
ncbi:MULTISPECIES: hypothetical protein [Corynebacterium]|uniref:hypothetical protein n=1 Tax=Corynebacterium TaxID=1716 RepID=UPI001651D693|nr:MULTISPECIES: hypothetical protein [Corynebacterium]MBC6795848.1 hypothetical protein [Corynebacterium sp. LK28]MDK8869049.1 hypothetical protein [Corynebacterium macclintockiae]